MSIWNAALLAVVALVGGQLAFTLFSVLFGQAVWVLGLAQVAAFFGAAGLGMGILSPEARADLFTRRSVGVDCILVCAVLGFALQFPLSELGNWVLEIWPMDPAVQEAQQQMLGWNTAGGLIAAVFAFAVAAPLSEEFLFRSVLWRGLADRHGERAALWGTAFLFGVCHVTHPSTMAYAFVAGLILGLVRLRTKSVIPCAIIHAAVNLTPVVLAEHLFAMRGFNTTGDAVYHLPGEVVLFSSIASALALAWVLRWGVTNAQQQPAS